MSRAKLIASIVLAVAVLIVVIQNTESVETQILFVTLTMPRAALLVGTFLIGFAVGVLFAGRLARRGGK